jgi:hypothetical protein
MELHLPYLALRELSPATNSSSQTAPGKAQTRHWKDLSFLNIKTERSPTQRKFGIYQARCSIVTCGSDNRRWVTYAFIDRDFDGDDLEEEDCLYDGIQQDPIASDCKLDESLELLDANLPHWDAREYFLAVFNIRMTKLLKEWENLVRWVERRINDYVCQN